MVLPVLVALTLGLAWVLSLAATQVRVVDAARETARAAARDDGVLRAGHAALGAEPGVGGHGHEYLQGRPTGVGGWFRRFGLSSGPAALTRPI